jgi:hypothetical protein
MEKVVPLLKTFRTIFYFNFFDLRKALFGSKYVGKRFDLNSNMFEWILNQFEPCLSVPPVTVRTTSVGAPVAPPAPEPRHCRPTPPHSSIA